MLPKQQQQQRKQESFIIDIDKLINSVDYGDSQETKVTKQSASSSFSTTLFKGIMISFVVGAAFFVSTKSFDGALLFKNHGDAQNATTNADYRLLGDGMYGAMEEDYRLLMDGKYGAMEEDDEENKEKKFVLAVTCPLEVKLPGDSPLTMYKKKYDVGSREFTFASKFIITPFENKQEQGVKYFIATFKNKQEMKIDDLVIKQVTAVKDKDKSQSIIQFLAQYRSGWHIQEKPGCTAVIKTAE